MADLPIVRITYTDLGGNVTQRSVEIRTADEERFEAICHQAHQMRTFRFDRVSEVFTEAGDPIDRDTWIKTVAGSDVPYREPRQKRPLDDGRISVVFTGLGKALKPYAVALAEQHDMRVVKSGNVSRVLGFLVTGETAGPSKVAKAEQLGVPVISYEAFCRMLETGELSY